MNISRKYGIFANKNRNLNDTIIAFLNNSVYSIYYQNDTTIVLTATAKTNFDTHLSKYIKSTKDTKNVRKLLMKINFIHINENEAAFTIKNNKDIYIFSSVPETNITTAFNVQKDFYEKSSMLSDNYDALCFQVISLYKSYDTRPLSFFKNLTEYLANQLNNRQIYNTKYSVIIMEYPERYNQLTKPYTDSLNAESEAYLAMLFLAEVLLFTVLTGYAFDYSNIYDCMISMETPSQIQYMDFEKEKIVNMSLMLTDFEYVQKLGQKEMEVIINLYKTRKYYTIFKLLIQIYDNNTLKNIIDRFNKILLINFIHNVITMIIDMKQPQNDNNKYNTIYKLIHQDYSKNEKECLHTCNNEFSYTKMCEMTNIGNATGTCWYSSILSILLFSDKIGEEFQKKLFTLSENDIDQKIKNIKREIYYGLIKGFTELNNIKPLLLSIKNRLCKKKCDIEIDIEEEKVCYNINMENRYYKNKQPYGVSNEGSLSLLNTLMYIIINKTAKINTIDINSNISIKDNNNIVAYLLNFKGHILAIFKCENKYVSNEITMNNILLQYNQLQDIIKEYMKLRKQKYTLDKIFTISLNDNETPKTNDNSVKDILMKDILLKMEEGSNITDTDDKDILSNITDTDDKDKICKLLFYDNDEVIIYSDETLLMHVLSSNRIQNKKKYIGLIFDCLLKNTKDENIIKYILYECGSYNKKNIISYCEDNDIDIYQFVDKNKHTKIYNILNKIQKLRTTKNISLNQNRTQQSTKTTTTPNSQQKSKTTPNSQQKSKTTPNSQQKSKTTPNPQQTTKTPQSKTTPNPQSKTTPNPQQTTPNPQQTTKTTPQQTTKTTPQQTTKTTPQQTTPTIPLKCLDQNTKIDDINLFFQTSDKRYYLTSKSCLINSAIGIYNNDIKLQQCNNNYEYVNIDGNFTTLQNTNPLYVKNLIIKLNLINDSVENKVVVNYNTTDNINKSINDFVKKIQQYNSANLENLVNTNADIYSENYINNKIQLNSNNTTNITNITKKDIDYEIQTQNHIFKESAKLFGNANAICPDIAYSYIGNAEDKDTILNYFFDIIVDKHNKNDYKQFTYSKIIMDITNYIPIQSDQTYDHIDKKIILTTNDTGKIKIFSDFLYGCMFHIVILAVYIKFKHNNFHFGNFLIRYDKYAIFSNYSYKLIDFSKATQIDESEHNYIKKLYDEHKYYEIVKLLCKDISFENMESICNYVNSNENNNPEIIVKINNYMKEYDDKLKKNMEKYKSFKQSGGRKNRKNKIRTKKNKRKWSRMLSKRQRSK